MKHTQDTQTTPRCLICNQLLSSYDLEPLDHPEPNDRALLCEEHAPVSSTGELSEVYASEADYIRRVAAISSRVAAASLRQVWCTTRYFSLLLELSDEALLLLYPVKRRPALLYLPKALRAAEAPSGLQKLTSNGLGEVRGPCDVNKPKAGLRGVLRAAEARVPLSRLDFQCFSTGAPDAEGLIVEFQNGHSVLVRAAGWEDLGYARQALDLSFHWIGGDVSVRRTEP